MKIDENARNTFASNVRAAIEKAGNIIQLAAVLGATQQTIYNWKTYGVERLKNSSIPLVEKLATYLALSNYQKLFTTRVSEKEVESTPILPSAMKRRKRNSLPVDSQETQQPKERSISKSNLSSAFDLLEEVDGAVKALGGVGNLATACHIVKGLLAVAGSWETLERAVARVAREHQNYSPCTSTSPSIHPVLNGHVPIYEEGGI